METVLGEVMFWGPGSSIRYCLIDEKFVRGCDDGSSQFRTRKEKDGGGASAGGDSNGGANALMPRCWSRGQGTLFEEAWGKEEEQWRIKADERGRRERGEEVQESVETFEQYREVGSSGM